MIERAKKSDLNSISVLMNDVFESHMQEAYTQKGRENFRALLKLEMLVERFDNNSDFFIYRKNNEIEGVLELESGFHIAFLFVNYQGKGIGTALCKKLIDGDNDLISVAAFPESISFYKKLGFSSVDEKRVVDGMPFVLMIKQSV